MMIDKIVYAKLIAMTEELLDDIIVEGKIIEKPYIPDFVDDVLAVLEIETNKTCDNCAFGELRKQPRGLVSSPPLQCAHCSANYDLCFVPKE